MLKARGMLGWLVLLGMGATRDRNCKDLYFLVGKQRGYFLDRFCYCPRATGCALFFCSGCLNSSEPNCVESLKNIVLNQSEFGDFSGSGVL